MFGREGVALGCGGERAGRAWESGNFAPSALSPRATHSTHRNQNRNKLPFFAGIGINMTHVIWKQVSLSVTQHLHTFLLLLSTPFQAKEKTSATHSSRVNLASHNRTHFLSQSMQASFSSSGTHLGASPPPLMAPADPSFPASASAPAPPLPPFPLPPARARLAAAVRLQDHRRRTWPIPPQPPLTFLMRLLS